ncbi:MAG TPA: type II toxin-antitoxin system HicA family toxin [Ktedonosporobacter sp.]|nr:type II toxin-antitoxin system HicA family toxin [Ktedonosporobacter sp.]
MITKMRALRSTLRELGFVSRPGRGSHEVWMDPEQPRRRVVLYGKSGNDAPRYLGTRVRKFRRGMMMYR